MRLDSCAETLSQSPSDTPSPDALLAQQPVFPQRPAPTSAPSGHSMTSTIALLPSSPLDAQYGSSFGSALSLQTSFVDSPSQPRPKLSLNTSSCSRRILGKGNTGVRLDSLSANSPTVQNTYKNVYEVPQAPYTPPPPKDKAPGTPARILKTPTSGGPATPHPLFTSPSSSSTSYSTHSLGSSEGSRHETDSDAEAERHKSRRISDTALPYRRTPNLHPILSNTPLPEKHVCTPRTAARRRTQRPTSVSFRPALTEEIQTKKYVAKHSDLLQPPTPSPRGEKRASPEAEEEAVATESSSESDSQDESCPKTPVAGRRKRRREWVWTLGPLDGVKCRTPDTPNNATQQECDSPLPSVTASRIEAPRLATPMPPRRRPGPS